MRFLVANKRATIFWFVVMPNHLYIIWQINDPYEVHQVQQSFLKYTLFPNPTSGQVNIVFNKSVTTAEIAVIDNTGRVLFVTRGSGSSLPLDISIYSGGIYFVSVRVGEKKFRNTVVRY